MNDFQARIGVGQPSRAFLARQGTSRRRPVVVEEGRRAGKVGGYHIDHWDGRVDATVLAPAVNVTTTTQEA